MPQYATRTFTSPGAGFGFGKVRDAHGRRSGKRDRLHHATIAESLAGVHPLRSGKVRRDVGEDVLDVDDRFRPPILEQRDVPEAADRHLVQRDRDRVLIP
jgi:hypothetical protein